MSFRSIPKFLLIASTALFASVGHDDFQLMHSEMIGGLKIGLSRKQVLEILKAKPKTGPIEKWDADGNFHQNLDFQKLGIKLYLVSRTKSSIQTIESITVIAPCTLATKRGIRIGSSEKDVVTTYKSHFNKEESTPGTVFIAGSTYGGMSFQFQNGRVSQIFLGAASE